MKKCAGYLAAACLTAFIAFAAARAAGTAAPEMVRIPAGWFIMGHDDGPEDSRPKRKVYLNAYMIDKFEVTNAQYNTYLDKMAALKKEGKQVRVPVPNCKVGRGLEEARQVWDVKGRTYPPELANHPVTCVSYDMAKLYCESVGKHLPTEAQWEKAARGTEGFIYPWGNEWTPQNLNHGKGSAPWEDASDGYTRTAPVGSFPKDVSQFGVYDMAGNVWEWTLDVYVRNYYSRSPDRNPPAAGPELLTPPGSSPEGGIFTYVLRGGSWAVGQLNAKSFMRASRPISYRDDSGGFRCAK